MHILFITREAHPCHRSDVAVLFGKYLPRFGVTSDLVALGDEHGHKWGGGNARLMRQSKSRILNLLLAFIHLCIVFVGGKREYGAIQVRDNPFFALISLAVAKRWQIPIFYWMSFPIVEGNLELAKQGPSRLGWVRYLYSLAKGHLGHWIFYQRVVPYVDHIFVQSERMKQDMETKGVPSAKLTPVPMGVDIELTESTCGEQSNDSRLIGRRVIVHLGSLDNARRIDVILEMLALAVASQPSLLLVFVGDAPEVSERNRLKKIATDLGLVNNVLWVGWLPMNEAWHYVRSAEIGLSPIPRGPLYDCASPTKAAEYLALGIPVLANDLPDQKELVEQSGGGFIVPFEPKSLAASLLAMLADQENLKRMGAAGKKFVVAHRSYQQIATAVSNKYAQLVRSSASSLARESR